LSPDTNLPKRIMAMCPIRAEAGKDIIHCPMTRR
jgi:hypothetical protein